MAEDINLLKDAVTSGDFEKIEAAIHDGTDINAFDSDGHTLLSHAVSSNNPDSVKKILQLGADVNIKLGVKFNILGYVALLFAENEQKNQRINDIKPEIVSMLIQAGADMSDAMLIGIRSGSVEFVDMLIQNGADINGKFAENLTPFAIAVLGVTGKVRPEILEYLAEHGANLNEKFDFGDDIETTALNICITLRRLDMMKLLLENGADPNIKDSKGRPSLILAVLMEYFEAEDISCLINAGADVNAQDNKGLTALMWAVLEKSNGVNLNISALIRTGGLHTENGEKFAGFCYALEALHRENQLDVVNLLLEHGANTKIRDKKGMTALTYAAMNFDHEILSILRSAGTKNNKS